MLPKRMEPAALPCGEDPGKGLPPGDCAAARFAWSLVPPIACLTFLAVLYLAPALARPDPSAEQIKAVFVTSALPDCAPKGLEHVRYMIAVVLPLLLFFAAWFVRCRVPAAARRLDLLASPLSVVGQAALLVYCAAMWLIQCRGRGGVVMGIFYDRGTTLGLLAVLALGYGAVAAWRREWPPVRRAAAWLRRQYDEKSRWTVWIAALLTAIALLQCLTFDNTIDYNHFQIPAQGVNSYHIPVILDEFAAVADGRTLLVDYFPQYQNLLPYLFEPYFKLVGLHVGTFTGAMIALGFLGLMAVYRIFYQLTPRHALWLYLPFLGLCFIQVMFTPPYYYSSRWTIFTTLPLRYLDEWLTLLVLCWYLKRPGTLRLALLFLTATLALINNLDFGVGTVAATLAAVLTASSEAGWPRWRWFGKVMALFLAVAAATIAAYAVAVWLRSGHWPAFGTMILFQKAFAYYGFFMIAMEPFGFHHLIYLLFMAAIWTGMLELGRAPQTPSPGRTLGGLLIFSGVFGLGAAGLYFAGRSVMSVLVVTFPAAALSLLFLVYAQFRHGLFPALTWRRAVPTFLLALGYLAALTCLRDIPSPWGQVERLCHFNRSLPARQLKMCQLLQKTAAPGEEVAISYPYSHMLAEWAGVKNLFPFATPDVSILLKEQVALAVQIMDQHHVTKFYGYGSPELEEELTARGFQKEFTIEPYPVIQYWERK